MADTNSCSISPSSLLCTENQSCMYENGEGGEDGEKVQLRLVSSRDHYMGPSENGDEYIEMLMLRERNHCSSESHRQPFDENWLRAAYLEAVQWILKMRAVFGFSFQTAYLSITYLYRFLLRREIDKGKSWAIQLLSMACLSIAVKMGECEIPALSDFCAEDYAFDWQVIQRMELLVLSTLDWRMNSITPFSYLYYFFTKLSNGSWPNAALARAAGLILDTTKALKFMKYRPSEIAAAAVLISSNQRLIKQTHLNSSFGCLEYEDVLPCYNQILELEKRNMRAHNVTTFPDISKIYASTVDAVDAVSSVTSLRSKRRKVEQNLQDCPISNQQQILLKKTNCRSQLCFQDD